MIWNEINGWNGDAQDQVPMILPNFYRQITHQRLTSRFCNTKIPEPTGLEPAIFVLGRGVFIEKLETARFCRRRF
jgi:hypothetical protein